MEQDHKKHIEEIIGKIDCPKDGINQGIPFEKLPDDWVCPICGAGKNIFKKAE